MPITETDYTKQAQLYTRRMTKALAKLKDAIQAGQSDDKTLLKLLADSRRLLNFVAPILTTGEIHGLSKSATEADKRPAPIVFREADPGRDFGAWWYEKTSRVHARLFELVDLLDRPESETNKQIIGLALGETEMLLKSILQLLGEDLRIREVKAEE